MDKKTALIGSDLRDNGFDVTIQGNKVLVSLNRPISKMEIEMALWNNGYENCQFEVARQGQSVIVKAI